MMRIPPPPSSFRAASSTGQVQFDFFIVFYTLLCLLIIPVAKAFFRQSELFLSKIVKRVKLNWAQKDQQGEA
jgi:hypothetical protein